MVALGQLGQQGFEQLGFALQAGQAGFEQALGAHGPSPFAEAMKQQVGAVDELTREVERNYKRPLG